MILAEVMHFLIEDGITEALASGCPGGTTAGAVAGYEACRGREPGEIRDLLADASIARAEACGSEDDERRRRAYEDAVRLVAEVLSCALDYHNLPQITPVTVRARMRYAAIVGYSTYEERSDATNRKQRR